MNLKEKVVLITGGGSGFGAAIAKRCVERGGRVIIADINTKDLEKVERSLNALTPSSCASVKCDVRRKDDYVSMFQVAMDKFGRIDVVVNNAGIPEKVPFEQDEKDLWTSVIDIDLTAVILGTRLALSHFKSQKKPGVIINTSSLAGLYPQSMQPIYAAAKGGVVHFTRSFSHLQDIRVVAICPSFSRTSLLDEAEKTFHVNFKDDNLVTVDMVVDAFMMAIEDERVPSGGCIRVTPEKGIDVVEKIRIIASKI